MTKLLTFDVGTTAMKAALFNERFEVLKFYSKEYELVTPQKDWVELDADIYWDTLKDAIGELLSEETDKKSIRAITITTQGETLIPVDFNGNALDNAMVWLDSRAKDEAGFLNDLIGQDEFYKTTGMPDLSSATPIAKLRWIKDRRPELYSNTYKFLLVEDFLIHRLTGQFVTEQSLLSSTGYFNINSGTYWEKILAAAEIDIEKLPDILPCAVIVGNITNEAAQETGLNTSTVVSTAAMDQISSAVGAGNIMPGMISETTGTALVIAATVEKPDYGNTEKVTIYRHFNNNFILLPYCQTAGIILKWFKDEFLESLIQKSRQKNSSVYQLIDEMAGKIGPGADGLVLIPNFAGKLNPDYNPEAKGIFYGIGLGSGKGHFLRAILEGIAFMLRENIEFMERLGVKASELRSLGGGSNSRLWSQIKADVLNKPVSVLKNTETASFGAAVMGALSIGLYKSAEEICTSHIAVSETFEPDERNREAYENGYRLYTNVYKRLKDVLADI